MITLYAHTPGEASTSATITGNTATGDPRLVHLLSSSRLGPTGAAAYLNGRFNGYTYFTTDPDPAWQHTQPTATKDWKTAWITELRNAHGEWSTTPGGKIVQHLDADRSYVPTDAEQKTLEDERDQLQEHIAATIPNPYYPATDTDQKLLDYNPVLNHAAADGEERRAKQAQRDAQAAAAGHTLDTSMFHAAISDVLTPDEHTELTALIRDAHLSYPDPKGEQWGEHGSPGYERAFRLDRLKYKSMQGFMENAGLPHEAAYLIAGLPDQDTGVRFGWAQKGDMDSAEMFTSSWIGSSDGAMRMSTVYDQSVVMPQPEVRPADFTGKITTEHKTITYGGKTPDYHYDTTNWRFDDNTPEARTRRRAVATYYGVRAQAYWTQQALRELKKPPTDLPVTRMVYGDQGKALRAAKDSGEPWTAATRGLSSWAEPSKRAENSISRYIIKDMAGENAVWLKQTVPVSQAFMHWRTEGELRNSVKALGEIVVAHDTASSANTTIEAATG
jgi:hypothetical protein